MPRNARESIRSTARRDGGEPDLLISWRASREAAARGFCRGRVVGGVAGNSNFGMSAADWPARDVEFEGRCGVAGLTGISVC